MKKTIKKEFALFLLAGYEVLETVIKEIMEHIVIALSILLGLIIMLFTLVYLDMPEAVVIPFLFGCLKVGIPVLFLSATITRYLTETK